ncbi:TPA_asm: DUF1642 domain-containing protein [Listeria monocytogenes]|nr:DUF1642 domain-containing protein [Listeria monocytogenes]EGQ0183158.1 DUF1642 domain-containing protein [Listeria monocytogenes]EGT1716714.1 DUF1642 domain-containing protein [Listeria monocytogenes]EII1489548.1 DUF1642 domain-containing protein [Listeria monocytogenes]EIT8966116.1 DUF1642 domain-containing protein [Listeria monocytogenes]
MKFKEGDLIEVIWRSELYRGEVTRIVEATDEIEVKLAKKPAIDYLFKQNQVSKVELVKVPKFVADWIEKKKENGDDLLVALDKNWQGMEDSVRDWFDAGKERYELFARAWLDGYEVEQEPMYYIKVIDSRFGYINLNLQTGAYSTSTDNDVVGFKTKFTEKEIKELDGRYWAFAVPVEEVEGE